MPSGNLQSIPKELMKPFKKTIISLIFFHEFSFRKNVLYKSSKKNNFQFLLLTFFPLNFYFPVFGNLLK